ncbi:hypothetical protein FDUTEX481_06661 [Tolypothrix sp. PCC 7601]|nr:hypothetical protein FDUTEX481_06661 [Tolypothrix sp. PCC 7601]
MNVRNFFNNQRFCLGNREKRTSSPNQIYFYTADSTFMRYSS